MKYKKILRNIADKEGVTPKQVEAEMKQALKAAGIECEVEDFIKNIVTDVNNRLYIV